MKCKRCNREMKQHTESGLGRICQMKANRIEPTKVKAIAIPLFQSYREVRSYVVLNGEKSMVTVWDNNHGRFGECRKCEGIRCEHLELVAQIDNERFSQAEVIEFPQIQEAA